jgi:hypothetical protein
MALDLFPSSGGDKFPDRLRLKADAVADLDVDKTWGFFPGAVGHDKMRAHSEHRRYLDGIQKHSVRLNGILHIGILQTVFLGGIFEKVGSSEPCCGMPPNFLTIN